jgi:hypothetical protein
LFEEDVKIFFGYIKKKHGIAAKPEAKLWPISLISITLYSSWSSRANEALQHVYTYLMDRLIEWPRRLHVVGQARAGMAHSLHMAHVV